MRRRLPHMIHRDGSSLPVSMRAVRTNITMLDIEHGICARFRGQHTREVRRCVSASVRHSWHWLHQGFSPLSLSEAGSRTSSPEQRESSARCSGHTADKHSEFRGVRASGTCGRSIRRVTTVDCSKWVLPSVRHLDMDQGHGHSHVLHTAISWRRVATGARGPVSHKHGCRVVRDIVMFT